MNDPRLAGRWWSTDPITKPWESPYAGYGNNPVSFIDPMGLDPVPAPKDEAKADPTWFDRAKQNFTFLKDAVTDFVSKIKPIKDPETFVSNIGWGVLEGFGNSLEYAAKYGNPVGAAIKGYENAKALVNFKETTQAVVQSVNEVKKTITDGSDAERGKLVGKGLYLVAEGAALSKGARLLSKATTATKVIEVAEVEALPKVAKVEVVVSESAAPALTELLKSRVQKVANALEADIYIVGSEAKGTATYMSDVDYIVVGNSQTVKQAKRLLPNGRNGTKEVFSMEKNPLGTSPELSGLPFIKISPNKK